MEKLSNKNRYKFQVYTDKNGKIYHLEEKIGKGGEGAIYTVKEDDSIVVKLYLSKQRKCFLIEKAAALVNLYDDKLAQFCALPKKLLYDSCGNIVGYIMENVKNYNTLYDLGEISNFNYKDHVNIALQIAKIFDKLYDKDIIICDMNAKNILINNEGIVKFIDCDSYQFEYNDKLYPCYGITIYSRPPELKDLIYSKTYVSINSSLFGLAILIFGILTRLNPYIRAGKQYVMAEFLKYEYQYYDYKDIKNDTARLHFVNLNDEIRDLFKKAFTSDTARPSAKEWIKALEDYKKQLTVCNINKRHTYNSELNKCIWCELEKSGVYLFG